MGRDRQNNKNAAAAKSYTGPKFAAPSSKFIFNSGDGTDYICARKAIDRNFVKFGVQDLVNLPPNAVEADIVETTMDPDMEAYVTAAINAKLIAIQDDYEENIDTVEESNMSAIDKEKATVKLTMDRLAARSEAKNSRHSLETQWENRWNRSEDKIKKCMEAYLETFGPIPIAVIRNPLSQQRYRLARFKLDQHYNNLMGNTSSTSAVLNALNLMPFDASQQKLSTMDEKLEALFVQKEEQDGVPMPDTDKLHYLIQIVSKSPGNEYKDELLTIKQHQLSYHEAFNRLNIRDNELRSMANMHVHVLPAQTATPLTNKPAASGSKFCNHCKKRGHVIKDCFKLKVCNKCNEKGHIAKQCPNQPASGDANQPPPQASNKASTTPANRFVNNQSSKYYEKSSEFTAVPENEFALSGNDLVSHRRNTDICDHDLTSLVHTKGDVLACITVADHRLSMLLCSNLLFLVESSDRITLRVILDSGATAHMLPYQQMICEFRSAQGIVYLGDGNRSLSVEGIGTTRIPEIKDVLAVPGLAVGIISVPVLDLQGFTTEFGGGVGIVYNLEGEVVLTATLSGNLYLVDAFFVRKLLGKSRNTLHSSAVPVSCNVSSIERYGIPVSVLDGAADVAPAALEVYDNAKCIEGYGPVALSSSNVGDVDGYRDISRQELDFQSNVLSNLGHSRDQGDHLDVEHMHLTIDPNHACYTMSTTLGMNALEVLHRQWGHLGESNIKRALKYDMVKGCKYSFEDVKDLKLRVCFDCLRGRMKAKPASPLTQHDWAPLEKIAVDFKGYFRKKSVHGYRGFLLFVDYATNYIHVDLVKDKGETLRALGDLMTKVIVPYKGAWDTLQSDSDKIFTSGAVRAWLRKNKIRLQLSEPYVHWQNGQVEVYIGIVMDKARILMCSYDVPGKFWEFAVLTAVYLINRSPTSTSDKSPIEGLSGEVPDMSNFVPFYAPGVYYLSAEEREESWSPKAELCRMLAYSEEHKNAYIVLNVRTGRVVTSGNCVFDMALTSEHVDDSKLEQDELDYEEMEDSDAESEDSSVPAVDEDEMELSDPISEESAQDQQARSESEVSESQVEVRRIPDDDEGSTTSEQFSEDEPYFADSTTVYHASTAINRWYSDVLPRVHKVVALPPNPKSLDEALSGPDGAEWWIAVQKEIDQFRSRSSWGEADQVDTTGNTMKTKLNLEYKYDPLYNLKRKARLVVCGYSQKKGIDYNETYAPTTATSIVFLLFHLAAAWNFELMTFDISAAYLEGEADCRMFAWLPPELSIERLRYRVEILRNWYGEKQAGKIWNDLFNSVLMKLSFERCPVMPCLYKFTTESKQMFTTIHVDDAAIITNDKDMVYQFIRDLHAHIRKVTLCEDVQLYLGMHISRSYIDGRMCIELDQEQYIDEEFGDFHHKAKTPMSTTVNLRTAEPNPENQSLLPDTGRFRYLADRCRPDILAAVGEVSIGGAVAPSNDHVASAKRIKNYLTSTKSTRIRFGPNSHLDLIGYCDAAYITDGKAKSRIGGCIFLGYDSAAIRSYSVNDSTVSHSSTEPEIKSIDVIAREIVYFRDILKFMGCEELLQRPSKIYVDSRSAIELCNTLKTSHKVKHINMRIHYIRELINQRVIELHFIPGRLNVADMLTKALLSELYERHADILLHGHGGVSDGDVNVLLHAYVFAVYDGMLDYRQQ